MRFIHTADWHLGNQMHDIDRREESAAFLRWLSDQIFEQQADALIVSGDIFDTATPSVEARRLYYDFLAACVKQGLKNIVIVGGNHDSAIMLDAAKEMLGLSGIHVVGALSGASPDELCFELTGSDGAPCAICMAIPFVREQELRGLLPKDVADGDVYAAAYKKLYADIFAQAETLRSGRSIPIIATGHLYAADLEGRLASASEAGSSDTGDDGVKKIDVLGTLGNVPPAVFPEKADYVALGHIHYSTRVAKNPRLRYSGSPFVLGFDEAMLDRSVLSVELTGAGADPLVEKLAVPAVAVYRRLSGLLSDIRAEIEKLISAHRALSADKRKPVYIEICYKKEPGLSAGDYLEETLAALPPDMQVASWKVLTATQIAGAGFDDREAQELPSLSDEDIFTSLILSHMAKDGFAPDSAQAKAALSDCLPLFMQIAAEVE